MTTSNKVLPVTQLAANIKAAITSGSSANKKARKNVRELIGRSDGLPVIEALVKDYADKNTQNQKENNTKNKVLRKAIIAQVNKQLVGSTDKAIKAAISTRYNAEKSKVDVFAWDMIRKLIPSEFRKVDLNAAISSDGSMTVEPISETESAPTAKASSSGTPSNSADVDLYATAFDAAMDLLEAHPDQYAVLLTSLQNALNNQKEEKKAA